MKKDNNLRPVLELIALSNYADFSKDGKLSINGIFDEIYAKKFPTKFLRGYLVFTISGVEPFQGLTLSTTIKNPQGKSVIEKSIEIKAGVRGKGNFIAELVGMPLDMAGEYRVSVNYRGSNIGGTTFQVVRINEENQRNPGKPTN